MLRYIVNVGGISRGLKKGPEARSLANAQIFARPEGQAQQELTRCEVMSSPKWDDLDAESD